VKYIIEGFMRPVGSIGITVHNVISVEADGPRDALSQVYLTHEHLSPGTTITPEGGEPIALKNV
jgi:hypothetical protein